MLRHHLDDPPQFPRIELANPVQTNRIEPYFRNITLFLNMNVRRLVPIAGVEEEAIGSLLQDRGTYPFPSRFAFS